jgi:hypothetical protein
MGMAMEEESEVPCKWRDDLEDAVNSQFSGSFPVLHSVAEDRESASV